MPMPHNQARSKRYAKTIIFLTKYRAQCRTPPTPLLHLSTTSRPTCSVDRPSEPPHHGAAARSQGAGLTDLSNRQTEILNIARAHDRVMLEDLARRFEVSAQTIRKDLNDLCDHHALTPHSRRRHHRLRRREPRL